MSRAERTGGPTAALVCAVGAALTYVGFLSWDRETTVDPVTQSSSGPYDTWQIACVTVALALIAYYGGRAQHAGAAAAAIAVGFTTAWSVGAATTPSEDADLWAVGAAFLVIGTFVTAFPVAWLTQRLTGPTPVSTG